MDDYIPTILIVDNDRQLAISISQNFQSEGYKTLIASSRDELVNTVIQSTVIDIVLLDLQMPDIAGEAALSYLRRHLHVETTAIIVFSTISDVAKRIKLINEGADDYIVKPSSPDDLLSRVTVRVKLNRLKAQKKEAKSRFAKQQQYLQAIAKIGLEATSYINLSQMVKYVTQSVVERFRGSQCCCIYIVSSENEPLQLIGMYPPASTDEFIIPDVVQHMQQTHQYVVFERGTAVPIIHRDSLLGVMTVATNSVEMIQEIELALTTLTVQLATVITNIRLLEDIQMRNDRLEKLVNENKRFLIYEKRQRQQAESLYYMAQIISSRLDENEVLTAAMDTIQALFAVETAGIRLLDGRTQHFTFAPTLQGDVKIEHINQPKELGIIEYVVNSKKPLILNHVASHPRFRPSVDAPSHSSPHTMLCTPLIARDTVIGAIQLINKESGMFNKDDLDLLNALASSISVAIDNSHLYQEKVDLIDRLKLSQDQLIQSEKMGATGRLAASLAHEINNPLQAIDSCLQLTIDFDLEKDKQDHFLGMAREEVERLSKLVTRIMDFARPAATEKTLVIVNNLMRQVLRLAQKHILHHNNWDIQIKLAANLPPISAIPEQISQVFLGIILNAFDAIGDDGSIRIITKKDGEWIKIMVKDNGCGISPDMIEHIFEPFLTTKASTAGLGLTIAYHIINQHGGMIEVKSHENVGTVFTVSLPVADTTE